MPHDHDHDHDDTLDHAEAFETFYTDLDPDEQEAFDEYLAPRMETP